MKRSMLMVLGAALALSATSLLHAQEEESEIPESPFGFIQYMTVHTDGEKLMHIVTRQVEGEMVEQTYSVTIPYMEDGVVRNRVETRTRVMPATRKFLEPIPEDWKFLDIKGAEIKSEDVVQKIPMIGRQVIRLIGDKIPTGLEMLVKDDVLILMSEPEVPHGLKPID